MEQGSRSKNAVGLLLKIVLGITIVFIILNLFYLDVQTFTKSSSTKSENTDIPRTSPNNTTSQAAPACSPSCLVAIEQATASSSLHPTIAVNKPPIQTTTSSTFKEFFIPFGSGSSTATDWTDVDGLQAYVDTGNYAKIKSVVFEASIHVPTGNQTADVRLFNATDQHPVWYSEQTYIGGSTSQLLQSPQIILDGGNKLYKVQMKTQLGYSAILDQARLHIVTQ